MSERYEEVPPDETAVTEVRREPPEGPPPPDGPPWWRENWWIPALVLILFVALLIGFFALRDRAEEEVAAPDQVTVPHVVGLDEVQARETLEQQGLEGQVTGSEESSEPEGTVIAQEPEAGAQLPEGGVVELTVSAGEPEVVTVTEEEPVEEAPPVEPPDEPAEEEEPSVVEVPDVVGAGLLQGAEAVEELGLIANTFPVESQEEIGTIVAQNPDPGTELTQGQTMRLNVSLGPGERQGARVPNVTGEDEADARRMLREAGFAVRTLDRQAPEARHVGVVILQQPEPREAPVLTQVTIYVGRQ
jgi:eukaryotic-like serine/threonine-protein kinase